ncbi:MAG: thioesterase [Clostridia bacterium]|nr:thioesterase [Clostridia bacterium]
MKKIQLFCIPYAGGKAEMFDSLAEHLCENIEVTAVEYSGHGARTKEDFYSTFDKMTDDVASLINGQIDEAAEIALFGYSMGSVVAFELLRRKLLKKPPKYLFIASHEAPGEHWESMEYCKLDDRAFADMLMSFGGFDKIEDRMLTNRFFRKMIFDPIRADYNLIGNYNLSDVSPIDIPVTMLYSDKDVPTQSALKWQNRFSQQVEFIMMGDNHFFIRELYPEVAKIINERLK